ncbi:hypothetical protein ACHHYP_06529, partial [Achlya hypogyna]
MLTIAMLVVCYVAYARGHVEGWNLVALNGVGGIVWLGRPMLFVRSFTALCLLSTATLTLEAHGTVVGFTSTDTTRPWYAILVASSEVLWLVLIVDDVAMVATQHWTPKYATLHRLAVWSGASLLTWLRPVQHRAVLARDCAVVQVDLQLVCTSASVYIGDPHRLWSLVVLVVGTQLGSYAVVRAWYARAPPVPAALGPDEAFFFYAGARYFFARAKWTVDGVCYVDPASAVLNGNLVFFWRGAQYVFDIKMW